ETRAMRTKEDSADYRYFPDPDLPPLCIDAEWVQRERDAMPELPLAAQERFVAEYGLPDYDALQLTQSPQMAAYFEEAARASGQPKQASNWMLGEISKRLNAEEIDISATKVSAAQLARIIRRISEGQVSHNAARQVFDAIWQAGGAGEVDAIIAERGLAQMTDSGALEKIVDEVIAANAANVAQFQAGKDKALNALVGQVMKASKGKANPQQVGELLRKRLGR
ncbi:MAG: Asp-tRNA(Asn)/Glu-tRNA(Gln) amidotransferase GatCAB subunit B, partial [Ottowia sp.]|nr:Asp-tRNA(Asn)/Glu-tRNA(Gln) amidotransferase GatCAB subunit B [Ottowia sp.]